MGIGIDITELKRFEKHLDDDSFINRILTALEIKNFNSLSSTRGRLEFLAGSFAAKEATAKALAKGIGPVSFKDMEISKDANGAPIMNLSKQAAQFLEDPVNDKIEISISHDGGYAMAIAGSASKLDNISDSIWSECRPDNFHMNMELDQSILKRDRKGYKSQYGRLIIIGGSEGMLGSVCLAARAALRSGAGLVYLMLPRGLADIAQMKLTEAIILPVGDRECRYFDESCLKEAISLLDKGDLPVLGPGLANRPESRLFVKGLLPHIKTGILIDADGLNALAYFPEIMREMPGPIIITPHEMEMSRLTGLDINKVKEDRVGIANNFSEKYNLISVLKGADTIITNGKLHYINPTGNPGMATAGSGDVLSGMMGAFLAYPYPAMIAARIACYLHGLAGDIVSSKIGEEALIASDIIEAIPLAFKLVRRRLKLYGEDDNAESQSR